MLEDGNHGCANVAALAPPLHRRLARRPARLTAPTAIGHPPPVTDQLTTAKEATHERPPTSTRPDHVRVGWIGAGRMGAAMASRLARAGVKVTVWNRTRAEGRAAGRAGLHRRRQRSPSCAGSTPSSRWSRRTADLEQVLLGEGGLLADPDDVPADRRRLLDGLDQSRSAAMRAACAERGRRLPRLARSAATARSSAPASLTLVVSGPEETFRQVAAAARAHRQGGRPTSARATSPAW